MGAKIKLVFAYDGYFFKGSAPQPGGYGVADTLNKALLKLGFKQGAIFASRTDKGVHANAAVATTHTPPFFKNLVLLKQQLNKHVSPHIYIKNISFVSEDFQPRFDAYMREYRYIFCHSSFSPFMANYVHFHPKIELKSLRDLLCLYEGEHDFKLLCKQENRPCVRKIKKAFAYTYQNYTVLVIKARGFLRGQIRMSVKLLLKTLANELSKEQFLKQLDAKESFCHDLVAPNGLYLNKITYRNDFKGEPY